MAKNDIHTYNDSVKGSITEDLKSKNYKVMETDYGRREAFKYVKDGSSDLNKTFDDRDVPKGRTRKYFLDRSRDDEIETNPYKVRSSTHDQDPGPINVFRSGKKLRPEDVEEKSFIEKYKVGHIDNFGRNPTQGDQLARREMANHEDWKNNTAHSWDKRAYNKFNSNIITQSQNVNLNTADISLNNFLKGCHTTHMGHYDRPREDKRELLSVAKRSACNFYFFYFEFSNWQR